VELKPDNIAGAMKAGDAALEGGIAQMKENAGRYGLPDAQAIEQFAGAARKLIYGVDGKSGIAGELAGSREASTTVEILGNATQTFFAQEEKTVGQIARSYTYGFAQRLKLSEPEFAKSVEQTR
jgi:hypothetical protein